MEIDLLVVKDDAKLFPQTYTKSISSSLPEQLANDLPEEELEELFPDGESTIRFLKLQSVTTITEEELGRHRITFGTGEDTDHTVVCDGPVVLLLSEEQREKLLPDNAEPSRTHKADDTPSS